MRRRRDEELYGAFDEQEDELSLEAILAEYGKGGRQPVLEEPSEGPPSQPEPVPEPEPIPEPEPVQKEERVPGPEYESPAPDRVALKDIMSQTVDAVLEDEDDGVIAQPVPLRERFAALLERFHRPAAEQKRRPAFQDTEQLSDEPEEELTIVRAKKFYMRPMTREEAILQMNLLEHTFFAFRDEDNDGAFAVVYKRTDGGYGLIEDQA